MCISPFFHSSSTQRIHPIDDHTGRRQKALQVRGNVYDLSLVYLYYGLLSGHILKQDCSLIAMQGYMRMNFLIRAVLSLLQFHNVAANLVNDLRVHNEGLFSVDSDYFIYEYGGM